MKHLFAFIFIIATVIVSHAQTAKQVVVVRATETRPSCMGGLGAGIVIVYPDKTEKIKLEKLNDMKDFESNAVEIRKIIEALNQNGYAMTSCSTSAWQCSTETLIIFEK